MPDVARYEYAHFNVLRTEGARSLGSGKVPASLLLSLLASPDAIIVSIGPKLQAEILFKISNLFKISPKIK